MRRGAALAVLPLAAVTACSGGGLPDGLKVAGVAGHQPTVTIPSSAPSGKLRVETLRKGKGTRVTDGDLVVADYVGYRWNGGDHKLVASSYEAGRPAVFPYGRLVTGLNKALTGQRPGGRVLAVIPPSQGYGPKGYAPWQIGAGDSMVFVVDVIATYHNGASAQGRPQPQNDPALPRVTADPTPKMTIPSAAPPGRLRITTIVEGSGPPVQAHQLVVFHDLGQVWRTGKVFESTRDRGRPDSVVAGSGQMIKGWDQAVVGRRVGSRVLVVVPPKDGYGARGHAAAGIGKKDTLAFVIDVLAAY
jgi:peptidylprolyl isomerase